MASVDDAVNAPSPLTYLIGAGVAVAVLAFRWSRKGVARPLNVATLWIVPAIMILAACGSIAAVVAVARVPMGIAEVGLVAACLAAGSMLGWWRGRFTEIAVDPASRRVTTATSAMSIAVIGGLIVVRMILKMVLFNAAAPRSPHGALLNVYFLMFGVGVLAAARVEMWLRARRLVAATPAMAPDAPQPS